MTGLIESFQQAAVVYRETKEVRVPEIPFPGGASQADLWREAADHLEGGYPVGGSNLTAAVIRLLRATAEAVS